MESIHEVARTYCAGLFRHPAFRNASKSYIVVDIETSGFDPKINCITQFGYCTVMDGRLVDYGGMLLKPREGAVFSDDAVRVTGITKEACAERGVERHDAIPSIVSLIKSASDIMPEVVGHNLASFDIPFLEFEFGLKGIDHKFDAERVMDTGMMVKAMRMSPHCIPEDHESRRSYFMRIREARSRVKWNLAECRALFNLQPTVSGSEHDASFDCMLTHLLYEKLYALRGG